MSASHLTENLLTQFNVLTRPDPKQNPANRRAQDPQHLRLVMVSPVVIPECAKMRVVLFSLAATRAEPKKPREHSDYMMGSARVLIQHPCPWAYYRNTVMSKLEASGGVPLSVFLISRRIIDCYQVLIPHVGYGVPYRRMLSECSGGPMLGPHQRIPARAVSSVFGGAPEQCMVMRYLHRDGSYWSISSGVGLCFSGLQALGALFAEPCCDALLGTVTGRSFRFSRGYLLTGPISETEGLPTRIE